MNALRWAIASLFVFASVNSSQTHAAQFILLRDALPIAPDTFVQPWPSVTDISSDGSTVIGAYTTTDGSRLYQWRIGGSLTTLLGPTGQPIGGSVIAVSADGSIVLGRDNLNSGSTFLWSESEGVQYINDLPTQQDMFALARDMSADGSVIVGNIVDFTVGNHTGGFVWTETNGLTIIPKLSGANGEPVTAVAVSDDGSTVVGGQSLDSGNDVIPILWTQNGGTASLSRINGLPSGAIGASVDGSVILGDRVPGGQRFLWSEATSWQLMSGLPGLTSDYGYNELAAGGESTVGWQIIPGSPNDLVDPIIWDQNFGTRSLRTLLETATGVQLNNNNLGQAEQVSANGTVIAGNGQDSTDGWIMVFEPSELVPEPSPFFLLAMGLAALLLFHQARPHYTY